MNNEPKLNNRKSKRQQIRILMGNFDDEITESLFEFIELSFENNYDLKFFKSNDGQEILELADKESVDIFILVINNIGLTNNAEERMENNLQLITQIQTIYRKPVIALCGYREYPSIIERAIIFADFFFFMPFKFEVFKVAFEKCLDMLPDFGKAP